VVVSQGRNVLQNKRYVGRCLSVSELSRKLFFCARKSGISDQTKLIILAQKQYPGAKLILDWWHLKNGSGKQLTG
jgi:hypothetical protein